MESGEEVVLCRYGHAWGIILMTVVNSGICGSVVGRVVVVGGVIGSVAVVGGVVGSFVVVGGVCGICGSGGRRDGRLKMVVTMLQSITPLS